MKMESRPIHFIADCFTCGKRWEGQDDFNKSRNHAKNNKHLVTWEIAFGGRFDYEKK